MRRRGPGTPALLLLVCAACHGVAVTPPAPGPREALEADALSAVAGYVAARAGVESLAVHGTAWDGLTPDRVPPDVWERIRGTPGLDLAALDDFARRNRSATRTPQLRPAGIRVRYGEGPGPDGQVLRIRLSRAGLSASGEQALVAVETWCGEGCVQGEMFLLGMDGGQWSVVSHHLLFIS